MKKICGISIEDFATVRLIGENGDISPEEFRATLDSQYNSLAAEGREGFLVYISKEEYGRRQATQRGHQ